MYIEYFDSKTLLRNGKKVTFQVGLTKEDFETNNDIRRVVHYNGDVPPKLEDKLVSLEVCDRTIYIKNK